MRKALLLVALLSACIEGPMGPAGPQGEPGVQGAPGANGQDGKDGASGVGLAESHHCSDVVPLAQDTILTHEVYVFRDGSVLATCSVWMPAGAFTGTWLWPKGTVGAAQGSCFVKADSDATAKTFGYWSMERMSPASSTASYSDPGSQYNGRVFTITCDD